MTVTSSYLTKLTKKVDQGPRGFPGGAGPVTGGVYPSAGIANSTGVAWGTSYTTSGSGTVVVLAASPVLTGIPEFHCSVALFKDATGIQGITIDPSGTTYQQIYSDYFAGGAEQGLILGSYTHRANQFCLDTTGKCGFGTKSPAEKVDIVGNFKFSGVLYNTSSAFAWKQQQEVSEGGKAWTLFTRGASPYGDVERISISGAEATAKVNFNNCDVGFGTASPSYRIDNRGTLGVLGNTTLVGYTQTAGGIHVGGSTDPGAGKILVESEIRCVGDIVAAYV